MKIYIVCPVAKITANERYKLDKYVKELESEGHKVHLPFRDTYQVSIGGGILQMAQNRKAIEGADEVHVFWNRSSEGSKFDIGMAYALRKPIVLINPVEIKIGQKTFENVLMLLHMVHKLGISGELSSTKAPRSVVKVSPWEL